MTDSPADRLARYGQLPTENNPPLAPREAQMASSGRSSVRSSDAVFSEKTTVVSAKKDLTDKGLAGWCNRVLGSAFPRTADELDMDAWISGINTTIRYPQVIGVVSPNGSTGKSSTTQMIGSTLAAHRTSSAGVVGVDIDASSALCSRMRPASHNKTLESVSTFARDVASGDVATVTDVGSYLVTNSDRFSVLPGVALTGARYLQTPELLTAVNKLAEFNDIILLDFPGSREVAVADESLQWIDALVFVVSTNKTSLDSGFHMLDQLRSVNTSLLERSVVLINNNSGGPILPDMDRAIAEFRKLIGASENDPRVFQIDNDSHIFESGALERTKTRKATQRRFAEVSSAVINCLSVSSQPKFLSYEYRHGSA